MEVDKSVLPSLLKSVRGKKKRTEFLFELKSHPEHESVLSISDTLNLCGVGNTFINFLKKDLGDLPEYFYGVINVSPKTNEDTNILTLVNYDNSFFRYDLNGESYTLNSEEFYEYCRFGLLLHNSDLDQGKKKISKFNNFFPSVVGFLIIGLSCFQVSYHADSFWILCLFVSSFVGLFLSYNAFMIKNGSVSVLSKYCKVGEVFDCKDDEKRSLDKKDIFSYFSDLGIIYFAAQVIFIFFFVNQGFINPLIFAGLIVGLFIIPLFIASIFHQWKVQKKWCLLCLAIILVSTAQTIVIYFNFDITYEKSWRIHEVIFFVALVLSICLLWWKVRSILLTKIELSSELISSNKIRKNEESFYFHLKKTGNKLSSIPDNAIKLNDYSLSKPTITLFTSVFCDVCKTYYEEYLNLLKHYRDSVNFQIMFAHDFDFVVEDGMDINFYDNINEVHGIFLETYTSLGIDAFLDLLENWNKRDIDMYEWVAVNNMNLKGDSELRDKNVLRKQLSWLKANEIETVPTLMLNNYLYPSDVYNLEDLKYFLPSLGDYF